MIKRSRVHLEREEQKLRDLPEDMFTPLNLFETEAAYDFVTWYATTGENSDYDWGGDINLPFIDVQNADVLESLMGRWSAGKWLALSHAVDVTLIKVRVLLNLQVVRNAARALRETIPQEIIEFIRSELFCIALKSRPEILLGRTEEVIRLVDMIKNQLRQLCRSIDQYKPYFWQSMLNDPVAAMARRNAAYSAGTYEEACLVMGYSFLAWSETPEAINVIRTMILATKLPI
ncbi:Fc.00g105780.m01.CDS01 [Cosmosporella sp. VM-42]